MEHQLHSFFKSRTTLSSNGQIIHTTTPLVMGIINITNDSFFSGSRYRTSWRIARRAEQILEQGGTIIDIGACSTRPGAIPVSEKIELRRLSAALKIIRKRFPDALISLDTFRANVAEQMVRDYRVNIINDISAGSLDNKMFSTVARLRVPYILMHMQGTPQNMQQNPRYENIVKELILFFNNRIEQLKQAGVNDIILDPGFGFGKTTEHNYMLLKNLKAFSLFELPILVGLSRKSMIYKHLSTTPEKSLNGTTVLNTFALQNGASILRVHDVREAVETIRLMDMLSGQPEFQHL